eukprot:Nitzschia sp. Nitz4//scaffold126_size65214//63663//65018//NITZ4_006170-RA/size65214-processed-gene-0.46-mRNA-1//-1//CDS//3329534731//3854//frame0
MSIPTAATRGSSTSGSNSNINSGGNVEFFNHAVSRSNELVSCCKTAWKIQKQRELQQGDPMPVPPVFQLASPSTPAPHSLLILEEGLTLLRAMEFGLKKLQGLVRRRGHTNDPTNEIATLVKQLEQDTKELTNFCQQLLQARRSSKQDKQHWELVVQWFQSVASHYSKQLQTCLKLRGDVLADQAQQRKKFLADGMSSNAAATASNNLASPIRGPHMANSSLASARSAAAATPLFDTPLFATSPPPSHHQTTAGVTTPTQANAPVPSSNAAAANPYRRTTTNCNTSSRYPSSTAPPAYGGYGGGYASYTSTAATSTGMRQRKGQTVTTTSTTDSTTGAPEPYLEEEEKIHEQIQQRKYQRQTQQRLDEARQVETKLGELGQVFGKMANLISQQGEVMEKIEDDVENAHHEVVAAQEELSNLYSLKKGNRPLIIKVFLVLNFLIIFMRAYKK